MRGHGGDELTRQAARPIRLQPNGNIAMIKEPFRNAYSMGIHVTLGLDTRLRGVGADGITGCCTDDDQE